jgi:hypothetical protein
MTKENDLSSAERSRLATKAALAKQAEARKLEEEREARLKKQQQEELVNNRAQLEREARPISDKLLLLLWAKIIEAESKGFKLVETFCDLLRVIDKDLLDPSKEELSCIIFNQAAEKLRAKPHLYKVRFGRDWSYKSWSACGSTEHSRAGTVWGEDAANVPDEPNVAHYDHKKFPDIKIEVSWEEESKNE